MKKKGRILIALPLVAAALWWGVRDGGSGAAHSPGPAAVPVRIAEAVRRDMPVEIREVGTVAAYETVAVRARLDSQVMEVKFDDGDAVREGQLLFVLDDRELKAQLGQLQANLARDQAQLENLRLQYERAKKLAESGFQSQAALDTASASFTAQQAAVGATQAAVENLRVQLGYTRITAPIGGRTGTINVTTGNTVRANDAQPLVTINQVRPIRVQAALAQGYFDELRRAMQGGEVAAAARRQDGGDVASGRLEYLDNEVDRTTGTFNVRAIFPNEDEALWPGMFVTLTLRLGVEEQALIVPQEAVQRGQDGSYVFVVAEGKAQRREVTVSRQQEGFALVEKGLSAGERVAVDGLMTLRDGSPVTVQDAVAAPESAPAATP